MKNIKSYLIEAFTGVIIIGLVFLSFVKIGASPRFDTNFWITFATNFGIMVLITSMWYPNAKQKAEMKDKHYIAQRKAYSLLMNQVSTTNNFKGLNNFCEFATERNRTDKIKFKLQAINVDYNDYLLYKECPNEVDKDIKFNKKQKKRLKKLIYNGVKVKNINPTSITTGIKKIKSHYDVTSGESKYDTWKITSKMIISVCCSVFMAIIIFTAGGFNWETVAQLCTWIMLVGWNCVTSYRTGYRAVSVYRADYYMKLRTFLEEFVGSEYFIREENKVIVIPARNEEEVAGNEN